ncbi:hypothetical protein J1N35_024205 [Gossypium stocksii]|uniref:Rx N-terminal domain-containing protein n=1 Tax=Gossypium stocksii TaxID=47602 RepID=A0A9D4A4Z8_9ROSI|nr:hypothetical protein J1N35_024205 [Gossypium stocksii]
MEGKIGCKLADFIENELSLMVAQVQAIKNELTSLKRELNTLHRLHAKICFMDAMSTTSLAGCLSRMKTPEKKGCGIARFHRQSYIDSFLYSEIMKTILFSSMSNGSKKRNRKLVSDDLLSQERERKRKQRQLRHRVELLTSQPQRKSKRKEGSLEKLINLGPLHTRAKIFDGRTQRGTNNNGKITDWERNWERKLEEMKKLVTMVTKASQCLHDVTIVTKFPGMKASQQILCYIDQIKVQWPMQSDLLVIKQEIQEIDRKYKDAVLAEDEAKWRLLLVGEKIEELDLQRSEFYFAPRRSEKVTATDDRVSMLTLEEGLSKFRDLENQLYDEDNNKVEYNDFLGLEQALKKTAWGKTPDYLQPIAIRIEKARGKATDVFHIPAQVPVCAAIKEMEDFPVEDLDWDKLKKWGATLNYAKKYGFQVGFADNLLKKNLLAYLVIQNLPNLTAKN